MPWGRARAGPPPDPLSMEVGAAPPTDPGDEPRPGGDDPAPRRHWPWVLGLLVLVAGATWLLRPPAPTPPATAWPAAPDRPVGLRWSLDLPGAAPAASPPLFLALDDDLLVQREDAGEATGQQVLERRDGATGTVRWSAIVPPGDIAVPLVDGRPLGLAGQGFQGSGGGRVRAISALDGTTSWTLERSDRAMAAVLGDGALFVAGDGGCGTVDATTGRARFVLDGPDCVPWAGLILWRDGPDEVLVDGDGRVLLRRPASDDDEVTPPTLVDDLLVEVRDTAVVGTDLDGGERWQTPLGPGRWFAAVPVGSADVQVFGREQSAIVDPTSGRVIGRVPQAAIGFVSGDERARFFTASLGLTPEEADGTWSRSPDAVEVSLYDRSGTELGATDLVVTSRAFPTTDGVLIGHGPDDDRRLSLFDPDDLGTVWEVGLDTRFGAVVASSPSLVAVVGDADGSRRLDVFGPEQAGPDATGA